MLIAFAATGEQPNIDLFLRSVAGHRLVQLTDETTPALPGCEVVRYPRGDLPFMLWRANAYYRFGEPGAYVDTDMLIQRNLEPLMVLDCDVLLTRQDRVYKDPNGFDLTKAMPYNGGMLLVKNTEFLRDVATLMGAMPEELQKWYGDQIAIAELAKRYNIIGLPSRLYNYTPTQSEYESGADMSDKWVLHFKGARKDWMRKYM